MRWHNLCDFGLRDFDLEHCSSLTGISRPWVLLLIVHSTLRVWTPVPHDLEHCKILRCCRVLLFTMIKSGIYDANIDDIRQHRHVQTLMQYSAECFVIVLLRLSFIAIRETTRNNTVALRSEISFSKALLHLLTFFKVLTYSYFGLSFIQFKYNLYLFYTILISLL